MQAFAALWILICAGMATTKLISVNTGEDKYETRQALLIVRFKPLNLNL
jgi:hypothetical protein